MSILVGLHHATRYTYDRPISLGPQIMRLRPAPHCRTRIPSYSLTVTPAQHFVNWQQDPARQLAGALRLSGEDHANSPSPSICSPTWRSSIRSTSSSSPMPKSGRSNFPPTLHEDLAAFVEPEPAGPLLQGIRRFDFAPAAQHRRFSGRAQSAPAAHDPLSRSAWSRACRRPRRRSPPAPGPAAIRRGCWCRSCATRPAGALRLRLSHPIAAGREAARRRRRRRTDFTDLHAWTEVYLAGRRLGRARCRHPGCCAAKATFRSPRRRTTAPPRRSAAWSNRARSTFSYDMSVTRLAEQPRVTAPFSEEAWTALDALGEKVDADLVEHDVRLTMGGEPTFVSVDDYQSAEWNTEALGAEQARTRRRSDPAPARPLRAGRAAALRPGQMVSGRAVAALGVRAVLAPRRRADLARRQR